MAQNGSSRSSGPAISLIVLGIFFLLLNFVHGISVWWTLARYWPVILILLGLGHLWDYLWRRQHPDGARSPISGIAATWIMVAVVFSILLFTSRGQKWGAFNGGELHHETQTIDLQGAKSLRAHIEMPAGQLRLRGGSSQLLQATFDFTEQEGHPHVAYNVSDGAGILEITQKDREQVHWGNNRNEWDLQLANNTPVDLGLNMGAGQGNLQLRDVNLTRLEVNLGAGQLNVDLSGDRKADLPVEIHGGVGQATIQLPKNVGVLVHAHGGIGAISTEGLRHEGGAYHNDAYGKSPVTIEMHIEGGVGEIDLRTEK